MSRSLYFRITINYYFKLLFINFLQVLSFLSSLKLDQYRNHFCMMNYNHKKYEL